MPDSPPSLPRLTIKKYPNRRFYDTTRSCHATLEDIHQLIRAGHEVQVVDSRSGQDITAKVLAQIILEMDSFKLDLFPTGLLHQLIRSNDTLVHEFVETYFSGAFEWFLQTKQAMEHQFRRTVGLAHPEAAAATEPVPGEASPWRPFWEMWGIDPTAQAPAEGAKTPDERVDQLHDRVERLSRHVEQLQTRLADTTSRPGASN